MYVYVHVRKRLIISLCLVQYKNAKFKGELSIDSKVSEFYEYFIHKMPVECMQINLGATRSKFE